MSPSRPFILRPVATSLLMAAILLVGMVAYRFLPLSALPEVDYPTIQITTLYPGASPEVMTSSVTAPLERQFGQLPGLAQIQLVAVTGYGTAADLERSRSAGFGGHLVKPISLEAVQTTIEKLLSTPSFA